MGPPDDADMPPTQLGKYVLRRRLGQGGMGEVFEATDTRLGRTVAIKKLTTDRGTDASFIQRFEREARVAASIHHPNVVTLFGLEQEGDVPFLVMEFVAGGNVESGLRKVGRFAWPEATRIVADTCRGLVAAHAQGMVHRDIKPANLLRTPNGVTKVADFGLARFRHIDQSITSEGCVVGTAAYMSPEQCRGDSDITDLTDVYSLGATYYTLLTGRRPFDRETPVQVQFAHCTAPVPDPAAQVPDLPEACSEIVKRAMAKSPADRFQSAQEMLSALERVGWLGDSTDVQPAQVRPELPANEAPAAVASTREQRSKARRWRAGHLLVAVTAILCIGGIIAVAASTMGSSSSPHEENGGSPQQAAARGPTELVLFDGTNLDAWNTTLRNADRWKIVDGLLVGHGPNNYLFTNKGDWINFHVTAEVRCPDKANAGLFVRGDPNDGYAFGMEAQLGWASAGVPDFGNLHIATRSHITRHVRSRLPSTVRGNQWTTIEVIAQGPRIQVKVDGQTTVDMNDAPVEQFGHIGLQAFTEGKAIEVRRLTVREVSP